MIVQLWREIIDRAEAALDGSIRRDRAVARQAARVAGMLDRAFDAADGARDTQAMETIITIAGRALQANRADDLDTLKAIEIQLREWT